ncbi:hypothetical protein ACFC4G_02750 [Streptomyces sp. NPDC056002]|uniref:hypothetical protein n=1 Tax=Streptomyces sp. NPDC056002 TaxID=3345675 RepID=UPI0035DD9DC0
MGAGGVPGHDGGDQAPGIAGAAVEPECGGMAGGAVNTFRQPGHALAVNTFRQPGHALAVTALGTALTSTPTSTTQHPLPHGAARTLAGCGTRALNGVVPEHALRAAFTPGLDAASVVAGCAALVAEVLLLALVRAPPAAHHPRGATAAAAAREGRGPSVEKSEATSPPKNPAADPR